MQENLDSIKKRIQAKQHEIKELEQQPKEPEQAIKATGTKQQLRGSV